MTSFSRFTYSFVQSYVYNFLDSIRRSREMENRYLPMSRKVKAASTTELKRIADRTTECILASIDSIDDLENSPDHEIIRQALLSAVNGNE